MSDATKVSVTLGYTLNLGNFQSLRVDLGVTDSLGNEETLEQATARVYNYVEDALQSKVAEAKSTFTDL